MSELFYGNPIAQQILNHTVSKGNLGHAYLIYGNDGLGKKTFARRFAQSVLCKGLSKPCGECPACHKIQNGTHPDVRLYLGGEAKNSVHIETVREIRGDCVVKPNEGEVKIYILTNVQNMTIGAFNAFLKTLEEPPKNVLFLLTAPNIDLLPETIVSRLTPVQLFPLSDTEMETALKCRFPELEDRQVHEVIAASQGNLGHAIDRLSDREFARMEEDLNELCGAIVSRQEYRMLKLLTSYERDKQKLISLLNRLLTVLRNTLLHKMGAGKKEDAQGLRLSSILTKSQVLHLVDLIEEMKIKLSSNANYNLLIVYLCAGMKETID